MRVLAIALLVALLSGCKFVEVSVNRDFPQEKIKKIAVLEFDHPIYKEDIIDKVSHGVSTSSNSGDIVADIVAAEMEDWGRYEVVKRYRIREAIMKAEKKEGRKISEVSLVYDRGLKAVREILGDEKIDAVVVGEVKAFEFGFILMLASGKVEYTARCLDIETGKEVWSFHGKKKELYASEEEITCEIVRRAIKEIEEKLSGAKPARKKGLLDIFRKSKK